MDSVREFLSPFAGFVERWDWVVAALFVGFVLRSFLMPIYSRWRWMSVMRQERQSLALDNDAIRQQFHLVSARARPEEESPIFADYAELVRLGDWEAVHAKLRSDEATRLADRIAGRRAARVGVEAAMSEIHAAVAHGGPDAEQRVLDVVQGFEDRFEQTPDDPAAAVLAAEAHMEMGWLYRGGGTIDTVSSRGMERMQAHFDRAEDIIRPFEVARGGSALLAAANFRLQVGLCNDEALFHSARHIWLNADAGDPEMMGQVAFHLLPRWYGSYGELHRAAWVIADRTREEMGDQAYAMTLLSVAAEEPELVEAIDADRLARGAMEMIEADDNRPETVNYVAAGIFCLMYNAVGARRQILRRALRHILETRMREFMLDFWPASLAELRDNLALLFGQELNSGATITIDEDGFRMAS